MQLAKTYKIWAISCLLSISAVSQTDSAGNVIELVRQAKQSGLTTVDIVPGMSNGGPPIVDTLARALRCCQAFVVDVQEKQVVVSKDGAHLRTWYEVQVVERLGRAKLPFEDEPPPQQPANSDPQLTPPGALPPLPDNGFYLLTGGGQLKIDGVTVKQAAIPVDLAKGARYVIFVRFVDNRTVPTRVAIVLFGDAAVFGVSEETGRLTPIGNHDNQDFIKSLQLGSDGDLDRLRYAINSAKGGARQ